MCLLQTNKTLDGQLTELNRSGQRRVVENLENRLRKFALEADINRASGLDNPANRLKYMPGDLRDVNHLTVGRHRVYYLGHHSECFYRAFYVKLFKQSGIDQEGDPSFQNKLRRALAEPPTRDLTRSAIQSNMESADYEAEQETLSSQNTRQSQDE